MPFNSIIFLFFFLPVFLLLISVIHRKSILWLMLISGILFFSWGAPTFIFILLLSVLADYLISSFLVNEKQGKRKLILWTGILLNLSLLIYYKYTGFFLENFFSLLKAFNITCRFQMLEVSLPLGISFFTFHKISYLIDVYRRKKGRGTLIEYLNYILFFPKMISGPILKWKDSGKQFSEIPEIDSDSKISGFYRFSAGLFKKVWIADLLGAEINPFFTSGFENLSSAEAWMVMIAYTFQIYFDFSGYTDMSIGLAKMAGIRLPENFNHPYLAKNIREFWQSWHISLTAWFKEYLFMPLAFRLSYAFKNNFYRGIKAEYLIYSLSVFITFMLTGLWHGAGWTFVIWGAYHGILLIADRVFLYRLLKKTGTIIGTLTTFFLVVNGWVLFRAENLSGVQTIFCVLFRFSGGGLSFRPIFYLGFFLSFFLIIFPLIRKSELSKFMENRNLRTIKLLFYLILLLFSISALVSQGFNPFIYFRF